MPTYMLETPRGKSERELIEEASQRVGDGSVLELKPGGSFFLGRDLADPDLNILFSDNNNYYKFRELGRYLSRAAVRVSKTEGGIVVNRLSGEKGTRVSVVDVNGRVRQVKSGQVLLAAEGAMIVLLVAGGTVINLVPGLKDGEEEGVSKFKLTIMRPQED